MSNYVQWLNTRILSIDFMKLYNIKRSMIFINYQSR